MTATGNHSHRAGTARQGGWRDTIVLIAGLFRRPKGMRNAPRGGDLFPSGPYPVLPRDAYREVRGDHPYPARRPPARTQADLPALPMARPYVPQARTPGVTYRER